MKEIWFKSNTSDLYILKKTWLYFLNIGFCDGCRIGIRYYRQQRPIGVSETGTCLRVNELKSFCLTYFRSRTKLKREIRYGGLGTSFIK